MANQVSKLAYVDSKLGVSLPGQQTTRVIYDTVTAAAGQQFFEFFTNFANKTEFQANVQTNKLDSAESMVIKSVQIEHYQSISFPTFQCVCLGVRLQYL